MSELMIVHHSFTKNQKKTPNCFLLFRKEMLKNKDSATTMAEFSKSASGTWKALSEEEKSEWRKKYEINRDISPEEEEEPTHVTQVVEEPIIYDYCYFCGCLIWYPEWYPGFPDFCPVCPPCYFLVTNTLNNVNYIIEPTTTFNNNTF